MDGPTMDRIKLPDLWVSLAPTVSVNIVVVDQCLSPQKSNKRSMAGTITGKAKERSKDAQPAGP